MMQGAVNQAATGEALSRLRLTACTVDLTRREVIREGTVVRLTSLESNLLTYLAQRHQQVVSREELLQSVWGYHPGVVSRAVDNTIRRLRRKIEHSAKEPDHLLSAYGSGYRLEYIHQSLEKTPQSTLVGRSALTQEVLDLLQSGAALTLVGPGGVGKTALARAVQGQARDVRAVFCDLRAARSAADLLRQLALTLDLPGQGRDNAAALYQNAIQQLAQVPTLLILDNLEQVREPAATLCEAMLNEVDSLQLLATSRHRLSHPDEHVLRVPPLTETAGRKLFALRARAAGAAADDPAIDMLIERLDGLPLAIELAAARASIMSPAQMLGHLHERFKLLRSDKAALQSTVQWSWDLLDADAQSAMVRLSAFEGSFSLNAAAAVLDAVDTFGALDSLSNLREHSLLSHAGSRYTMLESIRDFARGLATPADHAPHIDWMDRVGTALSGCRHGPDGSETRREMSRMLPDYRAALKRMDSDVPARRLRLAGVINDVLAVCGPIEERLALWRDTTTLLQHASRAQQAQALGQLADCLRLTNRLDESSAQAQRALSMGPFEPDQHARLLGIYGVSLMAQGQMAAAGKPLQEALDLHPPQTWSWDHFITLFNLGSWHIFQMNHTRAEALYLRAQTLARSHEARMPEALASSALGSVYLQTGNLQRAERTLIEALAVQEELGDVRSEASTRCNLAALWIENGRLDDATEALKQAIEDGRRLGENRLQGLFIANLALAHIVAGRWLEAADHIDRAIGLQESGGPNGSESWLLVYRGLVRALNGRHDASEHDFAESHQHLTEKDDAAGLMLLALSRILAALHTAPAQVSRDAGQALLSSSALTAARKSMDVRIVSQLLTRELARAQDPHHSTSP